MFSTVGLGGVASALLYRLGQFLSFLRSRWGDEDETELGEFGGFARQVFYVLEWHADPACPPATFTIASAT